MLRCAEPSPQKPGGAKRRQRAVARGGRKKGHTAGRVQQGGAVKGMGCSVLIKNHTSKRGIVEDEFKKDGRIGERFGARRKPSNLIRAVRVGIGSQAGCDCPAIVMGVPYAVAFQTQTLITSEAPDI